MRFTWVWQLTTPAPCGFEMQVLAHTLEQDKIEEIKVDTPKSFLYFLRFSSTFITISKTRRSIWILCKFIQFKKRGQKEIIILDILIDLTSEGNCWKSCLKITFCETTWLYLSRPVTNYHWVTREVRRQRKILITNNKVWSSTLFHESLMTVTGPGHF